MHTCKYSHHRSLNLPIEVNLVYFVAYYFDLVDLPLTQNNVHLVASAVEVSVVDSEVAEQLVLPVLDPQLRIAKNQEKLVINHAVNGLLLLVFLGIWVRLVERVALIIAER